MRSINRQTGLQSRLIFNGPFVVSAPMKKHVRNSGRNAGRNAGNRDGPLIFHMRDGPPNVTGPPGGTGPPEVSPGGTGPPGTTGPPMEWLVKKKNLKKLKN